MVLFGLRGVGKTVLPTQLRHDAQARDWWVVQVAAGAGRTLREMLGEGLYEPLSDIAQPSAGKRLLKTLWQRRHGRVVDMGHRKPSTMS